MKLFARRFPTDISRSERGFFIFFLFSFWFFTESEPLERVGDSTRLFFFLLFIASSVSKRAVDMRE